MPGMAGLANRKVIVTGASSGIGRAIAIATAAQGARVVLVGRNADELERTRAAMERPETHTCQVCDLLDEAAVAGMMQKAAAGGRIDGCVHAAGVEVTLPIKFVSFDKFDTAMRLHVYAFVAMIKALADKKVGADAVSVVALSSVAAAEGGKCQTVYSASKGALDAAIVPLSKELAARRMRINSIRPSLIRTPMTEKWAAKKGIENLDDLESTQLFGLGRPEDVANVAVFLLGDESRFVTGQHLTVDGGGPNDAIF